MKNNVTDVTSRKNIKMSFREMAQILLSFLKIYWCKLDESTHAQNLGQKNVELQQTVELVSGRIGKNQFLFVWTQEGR